VAAQSEIDQMTARNLSYLAGLALALVIAFMLLDYGSSDNSADDILLPLLRSQINEVSSVTIRAAGGPTTVEKSNGTWVVLVQNNYPANVGALRQLLLALADAKILERKTSDPEKYHLIGVNDPADEGSEATALTISGDGFEYEVIFGSTAQDSYRYVRLGGNEQSFLIDQDPEIPGDADGWLAKELMDITAERIQQVVISHVDGEEIIVEKQSVDAGFFELMNMPDGRELSYSTITNGIGAALGELTLEKVWIAPEQATTPATIATFRTFDGLIVEASAYQDAEARWFTFVADAEETAEAGILEEASQINDRVTGWQYALAEHEGNLLTRRFEDLLKAID
jgi:hypothetical protein